MYPYSPQGYTGAQELNRTENILAVVNYGWTSLSATICNVCFIVRTPRMPKTVVVVVFVCLVLLLLLLGCFVCLFFFGGCGFFVGISFVSMYSVIYVAIKDGRKLWSLLPRSERNLRIFGPRAVMLLINPCWTWKDSAVAIRLCQRLAYLFGFCRFHSVRLLPLPSECPNVCPLHLHSHVIYPTRSPPLS